MSVHLLSPRPKPNVKKAGKFQRALGKGQIVKGLPDELLGTVGESVRPY